MRDGLVAQFRRRPDGRGRRDDFQTRALAPELPAQSPRPRLAEQRVPELLTRLLIRGAFGDGVALRAPPLRENAPRADEQKKCGDRRKRRDRRTAANPLAQPLNGRAGPRENWLVIQPALQVFRQRERGDVTAGRNFLQALEADGLQI